MERLPGDVGLADIRRFSPLSSHATLQSRRCIWLATPTLIIDLRRSKGGNPELVSFLLRNSSTNGPISPTCTSPEDHTIEWWTDPSVPSPRFGGTKPIFVLTSGDTISAGEGFSYDLQQQQRADLVGEVTALAANFDYRYRVTDHLMFSVPSGHPVNPISGQGWEGKGVQPDIAVHRNEAFDVAYRLALEVVFGLDGAGHRGPVLEEAVQALKHLDLR